MHLELSAPGNIKQAEQGTIVFEPDKPVTLTTDYFERATQEFSGSMETVYVFWGDGTYGTIGSESESLTHNYERDAEVRKTCYWLSIIAVVKNGHTRNYLISQNQLGEWWFQDSQRAEVFHREAPMPELDDAGVSGLFESLRENRHPLGNCINDPLYEAEEGATREVEEGVH